MAVQTVAECAGFTYDDARQALRKTAQAVGILRSIWLAIEAQEDGSVHYQDGSISRWGPAVDGARMCVESVRDVMVNRVHTPDSVDWWTPLNLLEAMGAALWHTNIGMHKGELDPEQLQACIDAAVDSLGLMHEAIGVECDRLMPQTPSAAETGG